MDAPQNSIEAFAAALAAGATHLETDVRATADGYAVLVHDAEVGPAGDAVPVAALRLAELQRRFPHVCQVADAFAALPDARFNIDLKSADAVPGTVRAIADAGARDRVLVTSFAASRRRAAVRSLGGVATSASIQEALPALLAARGRLTSFARRILTGVDALQLPERVFGIDTSAPPLLATLHRAGVEVHIWVVNDPDRMRALVDAGVDGIVTDRPDLAAAALQ